MGAQPILHASCDLTDMRLVFTCVLLASLVACATADCTEAESSVCHANAFCEAGICSCQQGYLGEGVGDNGCIGTGYEVRTVGGTAAEICDGGVESSTCFVTSETNSNNAADVFDVLHQIFDVCPGNEGETCYAWNVGTTSAALQSAPSGLELISVDFVTTCASSACWQIKAQLTTGYSDVVKPGVIRGFNSLYVPRAALPASFSYSYDYAYSEEEHTFDPANFPCKTSDGSSSTVENEDTACCLTFTDGGVLAEYRVTSAFATAVNAATNSGTDCNVDVDDLVDNDLSLWAVGQQFDEMTNSPGVVDVTAKDTYVGRYEITVQLDEVEMRSLSGKLTGTVGVEYTVDTFLGWSHFKAVGTTGAASTVLESLATQQAIHLEKTNFFSVSTHGTNDYTFLEYVNLRLVAIYDEDNDFSDGTGETTSNEIRTDSTALL